MASRFQSKLSNSRKDDCGGCGWLPSWLPGAGRGSWPLHKEPGVGPSLLPCAAQGGCGCPLMGAWSPPSWLPGAGPGVCGCHLYTLDFLFLLLKLLSVVHCCPGHQTLRFARACHGAVCGLYREQHCHTPSLSAPWKMKRTFRFIEWMLVDVKTCEGSSDVCSSRGHCQS